METKQNQFIINRAARLKRLTKHTIFMKRFFLIPLLTLMCSVMAWAGVTVSNPNDGGLNDNYATFDAAVTAIGNNKTAGHVITLNSNESTTGIALTTSFTGSSSNSQYISEINLNDKALTITGTIYILAGKTLYVHDGTIKYNGPTATNSRLAFSPLDKTACLTLEKIHQDPTSAGMPLYNLPNSQKQNVPTLVNIYTKGTVTIDAESDVNIYCNATYANLSSTNISITNNGSGTTYFYNQTANTNSFASFVSSNVTGNVVFAPSAVYVSVYDDVASYIPDAINDKKYLSLSSATTESYKFNTAEAPFVSVIYKDNKEYKFMNIPTYGTEEHPVELIADYSTTAMGTAYGYIDLNGHTLSFSASGSTPAINVYQTKALTIVNTQPATGSIEINGNYSASQYAIKLQTKASSAANYCVLTIGEGVIVNMPNVQGYALAVFRSGSTGDKGYGSVFNLYGTINVPNGSGLSINGNLQNSADKDNSPIFNIAGTINARELGIYAAGYGVWNISEGAHIEADSTAVEIRAGELNILGGTIIANSNYSRAVPNSNGSTTIGSAISVAQHTTKLPIAVNINGGYLRAVYPIAQYNPQKNDPEYIDRVNITVTGGKFWATNTVNVADYTEDNKLSLKGGYYNLAPHASIAEGYVAINNPDAAPNPSVADGYLFKVVQLVPETFESTLTEGNWVVETTWEDNPSVAAQIPTQQSNVTIPDGGNVYVQPTSEEEVVAYAHNLTLDGNASLTVKDGATLVLGNEATVANTANLVVEAGGQLLIAPSESEVHPVGSVTLIADAAGLKRADMDDTNPNNLYWQHFAIPTTEAPSIRVEDKNGQEITTPITYYNTWDIVNGWENVLKTDMNTPFQGYNLSNDRVYHSDIRYIFSGPLVGNASNPLVFARRGFSFFGNSYLAPINIRALQAAMYEQGMEYTVYVYVHRNASGPQIYRAINDVTAGIYGIEEIKPMEGFFMFAEEASQADFQYNSAVYSAFLNKQMGGHMVNNAPARNAKSAYDAKAVIAVEAQNGESDEVVLVASENFSDDYDLKADARKMENSGMNIYADGAFDDLAVMATNDLMGQTLSFKAGKDALYTMTFSNVEGELALYDNEVNQTISIAEGSTYTFAAQPNSTVNGRFEIVKPAMLPTAIENTEVKANVKGIYTITGQYVGENFEAIPAGVYVVNGIKIVK